LTHVKTFDLYQQAVSAFLLRNVCRRTRKKKTISTHPFLTLNPYLCRRQTTKAGSENCLGGISAFQAGGFSFLLERAWRTMHLEEEAENAA